MSGVGWNRFSVFLFMKNGLSASQVGTLKTLGFILKILLCFNPYLFYGLHCTPSKFIGFGLNVGYGGFAKFRSGIYTNINLGNYSLGLASENILGFFTRRSSGQSLFIRLRCVI